MWPMMPPRIPPAAAPIIAPFTLSRLVEAPRTAPAAATITASRFVFRTGSAGWREYVPDEPALRETPLERLRRVVVGYGDRATV